MKQKQKKRSIGQKTNRKYKDGVFQLLFSDSEKLLELFNALEGTNFTDPNLIRVETLKEALYNQMINDLAFSLEDIYIVLTEHQATGNYNMPLRMYLYLARVYEKFLNLEDLYKEKLSLIPTPHFYVLYNGPKTQPPVMEYRLSDAFREKEKFPMLELVVRVININVESKNPVLSKSPTLYGYSILVYRIKENIKAGMVRDDAVEAAIKQCIKDGILSDFLRRHGSEVANELFKEYTLDDVIRIRTEEAREIAIEEGREQGIKQGIAQGIEQGIAQGLAAGMVQGEDRLNRLCAILLQRGRTEELLRATEDKGLRAALYEEFDL